MRFLTLFCGVFVAVSSVLVVGPEAYACSCIPAPPVEDRLAGADAVFHGTVLRGGGVGSGCGGLLQRKFRFEVHTVWKGDIGDRVTVKTGMGGGDCGMGFEKGEEYVIFASRDGDNGSLHTGTCSGNINLEIFGEIPPELGSGRLPGDAGCAQVIADPLLFTLWLLPFVHRLRRRSGADTGVR